MFSSACWYSWWSSSSERSSAEQPLCWISNWVRRASSSSTRFEKQDRSSYYWLWQEHHHIRLVWIDRGPWIAVNYCTIRVIQLPLDGNGIKHSRALRARVMSRGYGGASTGLGGVCCSKRHVSDIKGVALEHILRTWQAIQGDGSSHPANQGRADGLRR